MAKQSVAVLGGGISGLMACAALRAWKREAFKVDLYNPGPVGGEFLKGGFKYIHATPELMEWCRVQGMDIDRVAVRGGILVDGTIKHYPDYLKMIPRPQAQSIMRDHYTKTRGVKCGSDDIKTAMNDPWGPKPDRLVCDLEVLIDECLRDVVYINAKVTSVGLNSVEGDPPLTKSYDYIINTLPLWQFCGMMPKTLSDIAAVFHDSAVAKTLHVFRCLTTSIRLNGYDYLYTPYTPHGIIHRVSAHGPSFDFETTHELGRMDQVFEDIKHIVGKDVLAHAAFSGVGHIIPDACVTNGLEEMPENWLMVGRYAAWDSRATADKVFSTVLEWTKSLA